MTSRKFLRRWRENYHASFLISTVARPVYRISRFVADQIQKKVRCNSARITLPNGTELRFARDAGVTLASNLFWQGLEGYEPATSRTLRFFFERSRTFVDVGANYGFYSLLAALWNPDLRVFAFEPVPEIYDGLKRNIMLNRLNDRVTPVCQALSDASGTAIFYLPATDARDCESTGTLAGYGWQNRDGSARLQVQTVRFDDFEREHPMRVDLVKIDVEDFEAGVLSGMTGTILRDRPFIVCEILPREHGNERTRDVLESLGYSAYWITGTGYVHVSRFDFERPIFEDFLLSPIRLPGEVIANPQSFWAARMASLRPEAAATLG